VNGYRGGGPHGFVLALPATLFVLGRQNIGMACGEFLVYSDSGSTNAAHRDRTVRYLPSGTRILTEPFSLTGITMEEMVFKAKPAKNVVKIIALKGLKDMV
jgi:hypothetical protein